MNTNLLITTPPENSAFKSRENIQKKECGPDRSVSDIQSSSVTLNKLAMKARKSYCNFKFKARYFLLKEFTICISRCNFVAMKLHTNNVA